MLLSELSPVALSTVKLAKWQHTECLVHLLPNVKSALFSKEIFTYIRKESFLESFDVSIKPLTKKELLYLSI